MTDEATRVLNLIEATGDRIVIHANRKHVMSFFLQLFLQPEGGDLQIGIRKLAQLLDNFFDFRRFDKPHLSLGMQTIETKLHELWKEMKAEKK